MLFDQFCLILLFLLLVSVNANKFRDIKSNPVLYNYDDQPFRSSVDNDDSNDNEREYSKSSSTYSAPTLSNETKSPSKPNGLQFMITMRMKDILINDLGYLPEEVEYMEPQIAAVVIERNLSRPSKGMPHSWRRSSLTFSERKRSNTFSIKIPDQIKSLGEFIPVVLQSMGKIAPVVIIGTVALFQKDFILSSISDSMELSNSALKSFSSSLSSQISNLKKIKINLPKIKFPAFDISSLNLFKRREPETIDLDLFEKVIKQTMWEKTFQSKKIPK